MEPYNLTVVQSSVRPVVKADGRFRPEVLRGNAEHAARLVRQGAAAFRSKLFVLPEFCLHGFELGVPTAAWLEAAITLPGPEIEPLCQAARDTGAYVAGMAYERIPAFPGRFFNTAFIIDPQGEIALRYRKMYSLTGKTTPQDVYTEYCRLFGGPESLFPVLDTPLGRLGALGGQQPSLVASLGQAQVGVVLAQQQPVLGTPGHDAIGFRDLLGDQVVD